MAAGAFPAASRISGWSFLGLFPGAGWMGSNVSFGEGDLPVPEIHSLIADLSDNAVSSLDALGRAIGPTYAAVDVHVVVVVVLSFSPLQDQKEGGERQQR